MADEDVLVEAFTAEDPAVLQKESHLVILKRSTSKRCCIISFIIVVVCLAVAMVVIAALAVALVMANSDEGKGIKGGHSGTTSTTSSISPSSTVNRPSPTVNPTQEVCLTESCVQLAAKVLSGLDQSINPCENFYNFTCGNWIYNTIIPKGSVASFPGLSPRLLSGGWKGWVRGLRISLIHINLSTTLSSLEVSETLALSLSRLLRFW